MRIANELRVGIMFLIGLVLLVLVIATVTRWGQTHRTYEFQLVLKQAQGIEEGAAVLVAGVEEGYVSSISLNPHNEAVLMIRVNNGVRLYDDYLYTVGVGGIVGERYVDIRPTTNGVYGERIGQGDVVYGVSPTDFNDVVASANDLVGKLSVTVDSLNSVVGDRQTQQNLRAAVAGLRETTNYTARFAASLNDTMAGNRAAIDLIVLNLQETSSDIRRISDTLGPQLENTTTIRNLELATGEAVNITRRLDRVAAVIESVVSDKELVKNLQDTTRNLRDSTAQLQDMLADVHDVSQPISDIVRDVRTTSKNIADASENVKTASADLPNITHPFAEVAPETAENVRQLSLRLRETSERIGGIAERVETITNIVGGSGIETSGRVLVMTGEGQGSRSDLNADIKGPNTMLRLGVADLGRDSKLNVQFGRRFGENTWLRYGVVQSAFGVGVDARPAPDWRVSAELFDPNRLRANGFVEYNVRALGPEWWLTGGWYNLLNEGSLGLGVTYRPQ